MTKLTKLTLWTIVASLLIIVGLGHGAGFFGIIEFLSVANLFDTEEEFKLFGSYEDTVFASGLIMLIGQIVLIVSIFIREKSKYICNYLGATISLISFVILVQELFTSSIASFTFWTGAPFLILLSILVIFTIRTHRKRYTTIKVA